MMQGWLADGADVARRGTARGQERTRQLDLQLLGEARRLDEEARGECLAHCEGGGGGGGSGRRVVSAEQRGRALGCIDGQVDCDRALPAAVCPTPALDPFPPSIKLKRRSQATPRPSPPRHL